MNARIGDLVLNPLDKSLWGIRHQNGFATIVRIPAPYAVYRYSFLPYPATCGITLSTS